MSIKSNNLIFFHFRCELSGDIAKCVETEVIARNLNPEDF